MLSRLLCEPAEKAAFEARNAVDQIDYLSYLVEYGFREVRESHLRKLHAMAVRDIYGCAGQYRHPGADVRIVGSTHKPPQAALVPGLVADLMDHLNDPDKHASAVDCAAYALWRVAWIHPFHGGNGRTARALSYLIICMDLRGVLPGMPQMPSLINDAGPAYVAALEAADRGERETGAPDLEPIRTLVKDVIETPLAKFLENLDQA